jgi:hypothetical protein
MAAHLVGAGTIIAIDMHPERLKQAWSWVPLTL